MDLATQLLLCLTVVAVCAGIVRWVRLPLPVLQTLAGAILAWPIGVHFELDPHAFLLVLIPPLLYIDAWRMPKSDLRANRATILLMAFGLVVITVLIVGVLADYLVPGVPLPVAFAIAAALSPTDAVAVAGITGRVAVPHRLMIILQGEALFNDASGLVAMRVAVVAMLTGAFSWAHAAGS
ncbi:MAG TPA: cation:proton antiporter, partial [Kofleriaceae bacterium]